MADYQGKNVVIIGLGLTGLSCVDFFLARGVTPRVMDTRMTPPGLDKLPEAVERHTGGLNDEWLMAADLIVASPGIALAHPSLSAAADAGIEIVGDIELFCREAQAPIVAITGSNGKSTVTTLVGEMAKAAGMLPTKGLTLPLISYGGSSLLIMSTAIMMLLRIDYETRLEKAQAFVRGSR